MSDSNQVSLKRKAPNPVEEPSPSSVPKLEEKWVEFESDTSSHYGTSFEKFRKFKDCNEFTDFTINVGDEDIPVHKMILAASSEYFERMLSCSFKEAEEGVMHIREVDPVAVKICIDFIYSGKVRFAHSCEFAEKLIHAAELFQLTKLTDLYFKFLQQEVSVENCLQYIVLAQRYSKRLFASFFQNFSRKNFDEVIHCDVFLNLSKSYLEDLLSSIPMDDSDLEILKWQGIKLWIQQNDEDRGQYILDLLKYVCLEQLPLHQLKEISSETKGKQSLEFKDTLLDAFSSVSNLTDASDSNIGATHVVVCNAKSRLVLAMNISTRKWSRYASVPQNLSLNNIDLVASKKRVYITTANSIYKLENGKFSVLGNFSNAGTSGTAATSARAFGHSQTFNTNYHQSIAHGELIYIITLNRIVKVNTKTNTFTSVNKQLPLAYDSFFIAASNTHIYAMAQERVVAYRMSFTDEVWEPMSGIDSNNALRALFWHNSKLHCFRKFVRYYDYEADMWVRDKKYQEVDFDCKPLSIGGDIYLVGGHFGISKLQRDSLNALTTRNGLHRRLACAIIS